MCVCHLSGAGPSAWETSSHRRSSAPAVATRASLGGHGRRGRAGHAASRSKTSPGRTRNPPVAGSSLTPLRSRSPGRTCTRNEPPRCSRRQPDGASTGERDAVRAARSRTRSPRTIGTGGRRAPERSRRSRRSRGCGEPRAPRATRRPRTRGSGTSRSRRGDARASLAARVSRSRPEPCSSALPTPTSTPTLPAATWSRCGLE